MAFKKFRNMKVYEQSGYNYKSTPTIMLKGQWLKEAGFNVGDSITVATLRKLKDENGQYLWQPSLQAGEPDRLFGYEVMTSAYVLQRVSLLLPLVISATTTLVTVGFVLLQN